MTKYNSGVLMFVIKKRFKTLSIVTLTLVFGYFFMIAYLIFSDEPSFPNHTSVEMTVKEIEDIGFEQFYQSEQRIFNVRDGNKISSQYFANDSPLTVIILHGILVSSYTNNRFAGLIREAANAEVYSLDLRGHGMSDGQPGDVSYIGQYVDDVADIVKQLRSQKPNGKIVIAGHSMGGGISLRYGLKQGVPDIDGYLLFAPQLGENSPTNRDFTYDNKEQEKLFMAVHFSRLIGLVLLNSLNIDDWNDLPVFFFNLPVGSPISQYSYRSSASMSPKDYRVGLQAVNKPLLIIVGEDDEAFNAIAYQEAVSRYSSGESLLVKGQTHNGIRHDIEAMQAVKSWVNKNNLLMAN